MFRASRCEVEIVLGRITQRTTRDTTNGEMFEDLRVERKVKRGLGVVECRARRWRVQSGMVVDSTSL